MFSVWSTRALVCENMTPTIWRLNSYYKQNVIIIIRSKECPRGPSRPPSGTNGYRSASYAASRDPYAPLPPPPPSYLYRERLSARYSVDRMRPYPDPYDRRPLPIPPPPPPVPTRSSVYDRRSPIGRPPPDYVYTRRSPPPSMPRHR